MIKGIPQQFGSHMEQHHDRGQPVSTSQPVNQYQTGEAAQRQPGGGVVPRQPGGGVVPRHQGGGVVPRQQGHGVIKWHVVPGVGAVNCWVNHQQVRCNNCFQSFHNDITECPARGHECDLCKNKKFYEEYCIC